MAGESFGGLSEAASGHPPALFQTKLQASTEWGGGTIFSGMVPYRYRSHGRQGKRVMATEHEGSAPERDQVARMVQDLEKRMSTLSDAVLEQSTESAQFRQLWREFVAIWPEPAGFRRDPGMERNLSLWLAGDRGQASSREPSLVQGDVSVPPSLDEINALLERL